MFEIAAGILLAVAILYFLPVIITFAVSAVGLIIIVGVAGVIAFFAFTEFESLLILVGVFLGGVFLFTIVAAALGIIISHLPILRKRYKNRVALVKPLDKDIHQYLSEVYKYYQPIGISVFAIGIFSFIVLVILTAIATEIF